MLGNIKFYSMIDPESVRLEASNFIILDHQHDKEPERELYAKSI